MKSKITSASLLVLVVEDNFDLCEMMLRYLVDMGFQVLSASSGAKALNVLRVGANPAIVVCDLHLDDIRGDLLIGKMRSTAKFSAIIWSSDSAGKVIAASIGAAYLSKTSPRAEVEAAIHSAMGARKICGGEL